MAGDDTICAISTPVGEGGIGIIRMSGPKARSIFEKVFLPKKRQRELISHRFNLGRIISPATREPIDEVLAVFMAAPRTYTREDIVEIHCHGGSGVERSILALLTQLGARLSEPGEFTKRAFLNGRLDLIQAESVLDIIESETEEEARQALLSLSGRLSRKIKSIEDDIREALVLIEAWIDFPDEELEIDWTEIINIITRAQKNVRQLVSSYNEGRALRDGLETLIIGRTNVGKSSLLNALLLKEKAIVTPIHGTTRDMIEDTIHIRGLKIKIVDSAGLRQPKDPVEREGIERVRKRIPGADLIIWVIDSSEDLNDEDKEIFATISGKNHLVVLNKNDLPEKIDRASLSRMGITGISLSAKNDIAIDYLKEEIYRKIAGHRNRRRSVLITNLRHHNILGRVESCLENALGCYRNGTPLEFLAFELREATDHLGALTGDNCSDEILHQIFQKFCIGK